MRKKIALLSFVFLLALTFVGFNPTKVQARAAGPLTSFTIEGYSWPSQYSNGGTYTLKRAASSIPVPQTPVYIVAKECGYGGRPTIKVDGQAYSDISIVDKVPAYYIIDPDVGRVVGGWYDVVAVNNLSNGTHTISASNYGLNGGGYYTDTITLNVQA